VCSLRGTDCIFTRYLRWFLSLRAVPWLRRLVASLSGRRPRFVPRSVHVELVVDKLALGQVFLPTFMVFPDRFIPPMFHTHLYLHVALIRMTNGRSLGTFQKAMLFQKIGEHWIEKCFHSLGSFFTNKCTFYLSYKTLTFTLKYIRSYMCQPNWIIFRVLTLSVAKITRL